MSQMQAIETHKYNDQYTEKHTNGRVVITRHGRVRISVQERSESHSGDGFGRVLGAVVPPAMR